MNPVQRALTVPQLLLAARAVPEINIGGSFVPAAKHKPNDAAILIIPTDSVRVPECQRTTSAQLALAVATTYPTARVDMARVRFPFGETLPALAVCGASPKGAGKIARRLGLDYLWEVASGRVAMHLSDGSREVPDGATADEQAHLTGPALAELLGPSNGALRLELPRWTTVARPGWVIGGPLQLTCERCDAELKWADWWNADAVRMKNAAFVYCPLHGGPVERSSGRSLRPLIGARRQLDGATWANNTKADQRRVYAFELLELGHEALYVGETGKSVEERYKQHCAGGPLAAAILRSGRAQCGPLRMDRLPELPPLLGKRSSLAAEHWASTRLSFGNVRVYGDGLP